MAMRRWRRMTKTYRWKPHPKRNDLRPPSLLYEVRTLEGLKVSTVAVAQDLSHKRKTCEARRYSCLHFRSSSFDSQLLRQMQADAGPDQPKPDLQILQLRCRARTEQLPHRIGRVARVDHERWNVRDRVILSYL